MKKVIAAVMIMILVCAGLSGAAAEQSSAEDNLQRLREGREGCGPEYQQLMEMVMAIPDTPWENAFVARELNEEGTAQLELVVDVSEDRPTYYYPWFMNWITLDELDERTPETVNEQRVTAWNMESRPPLVNQRIVHQNDGKDIQTTQWIGAVVFANENEGLNIEIMDDEAYLCYSYDWKANDQNTGSALNVRTTNFYTDQDEVGKIVEFAVEQGITDIPEVCDWVERHRGESTGASEQAKEEIQEDTADGDFIGEVVIRPGGNVNVREKSNADSPKLGIAKAGAVYPCLSVADNGWFEIQLEDGTVGFISSKMASLVE